MAASPRPESKHTNQLGQPVGEPLPNWTERPRPTRAPIEGRLCRLEPLKAGSHVEALYEAHALDADGRNWTYLPYGPFATPEDLSVWIGSVEKIEDPLFFAIIDVASSRAVGWASYLRIDPAMGSIEVGPRGVLAGAAANAGGDRGDVPDDAAGVRRAGLPAV